MSRFLRLVLVLTVIGVGVATAAPASAVNVPAFTWVVPCNDPDGVATDEVVPGLEMPSGIYVVTAVGVCSPDAGFDFGLSTSTPCSTTTTGPLPCATTSLRNLPGQVCWNSVLFATAQVCGPNGTGASLNNCGTLFGVIVDDQCLALGGAGTINHGPGPMRARFNDSGHGDNAGVFIVTAALTPL